MNSPDIHLIFLSIVGGLFSTLLMTFVELPSWKRWGLYGVFEWHENQVITSKIFKLTSKKNQFMGIFAFHFLNGGLGGIGFLLVLWLFPASVSHILVSSIIYGLFLWGVTLIPIHKQITGISPWSHPLGHFPALTSLVGHVVYGAALGYFFMNTPF
jgi:hypothetical protein